MITGFTYDIQSIDVLNTLVWETLDQKRNYTKSMLMYKKINDHAAPNLKQFFRQYSEGNTLHDLRNRATDSVYFKNQKNNVAKRVLNTMELSIGRVYLIKQRHIGTFKRIINSQ